MAVIAAQVKTDTWFKSVEPSALSAEMHRYVLPIPPVLTAGIAWHLGVLRRQRPLVWRRYISEMRTQVAGAEGAGRPERAAAPLAPARSPATTPEHGRVTPADSPGVGASGVAKEVKGLKWRVFLAPLRLISAVRPATPKAVALPRAQ
jgi:hypothetical protein